MPIETRAYPRPRLARSRVGAFWEPSDPALISLPGQPGSAHGKPALVDRQNRFRIPGRFGRRRVPARSQKNACCRLRGTEGSNPSPSRGKSANFWSLSVNASRDHDGLHLSQTRRGSSLTGSTPNAFMTLYPPPSPRPATGSDSTAQLIAPRTGSPSQPGRSCRRAVALIRQ